MTPPDSAAEPPSIWLWGVVAAGLILRLAWVLHLPSDPASIAALPDQREYIELARNLLGGRGLVLHDDRFHAAVFAYRTPGYPFLLAACNASIFITRIVQAVLDSSTILAVYLLARCWLARRTSLLAAAIVAVNPFLIYFTGLILSETLYTVLLAWGMAFLAKSEVAKVRRARRKPRRREGGFFASFAFFCGNLLSWISREKTQKTQKREMGSGGVGTDTEAISLRLPSRSSHLRDFPVFSPSYFAGLLLLAVSVLVRPSAIALPMLLAAMGVLLNRGDSGAYILFRRALFGSVAAALATVAVLAPWAFRNHAVLGQWVWTTTNSGITLYDGFNPTADGSSDQRFITQMPQLKSMSEVDRSSYLAGQAHAFIIAHPSRVIALTLRKLARTWSPIPLSNEYGTDRRYVVVGLLYTLPLFVLTLLGLLRMSADGGTAIKVFLLLPAIYLTVVHAASVGSLRYRIPADVPMAVVAAVALRRR